jgi:hypothetical protein
MPGTLAYSATLVIEECYKCHITFAIPRELHRQCKEGGMTFYCPLGHGQVYTVTEVQRLKDKLAQEARQRERAETVLIHERDQRQAAERSASAYKGRVTRLKNRAAAGVCPCCTRHFENLERHMTAKHPGFTENPDE